MDINNVLAYMEAVLEAEKLPENLNFILFGFSQGVSVATRWWSHAKKSCDQVILYAGGIPNELTKADFAFVDFDTTKIQLVYGDADEFLTPDRLQMEKRKIETLFQGKAEIIRFSGGHEVKPSLIHDLLTP